jgi:hypothetical protein
VLKHKGNGTRGDGAGGGSCSSSRFNNVRSLPSPEDLFEEKKGFMVDRQNLPSGRDYGGMGVMSATGKASIITGTRLRIQDPKGSVAWKSMREAMIDEVMTGEAMIDVEVTAEALIGVEVIDAMVTGGQSDLAEVAEETITADATPAVGGPMIDMAHLTEEHHGAGAEAETSPQHAKSTSERSCRFCSTGRKDSAPKQASSQMASDVQTVCMEVAAQGERSRWWCTIARTVTTSTTICTRVSETWHTSTRWRHACDREVGRSVPTTGRP